jgi:hypothetical protein
MEEVNGDLVSDLSPLQPVQQSVWGISGDSHSSLEDMVVDFLS